MKTPQEILDAIEAADRMAPPGSHRHGELLRAALQINWPYIKVLLERRAYDLTQQY